MIHIIMGLPGSGKSAFSQILQRRLSGFLVNTDELREALFLVHRRKVIRDFPKQQLEFIYSILGPLAVLLINAFPINHLIFDGSFRYSKQRRALVEVAIGLKQPICIVFIKADELITKERIGPEKFAVYKKVKHIFEKPRTAVLIDNSGSLKELATKADEYIEQIKRYSFKKKVGVVRHIRIN